MFDFKNTGICSVLCTLLLTSQQVAPSLAAALPQPPYRNVSLSDPPTQNISLSSESRELVSEFHAPDHSYVAPLALPQKAYSRELKWQPVMDFDTDSCYNSVAINKYGDIAKGLSVGSAIRNSERTENCRGRTDLDNTNVYVRRRCNRGICAYIYAYYFPKDVGILYGHRHDWEHVVVWTSADKETYKNEEILYIGTSAHGNWDIRRARDIRMEGTHPKIVYHLNGNYPGATHSMRFADKSDDSIENYLKVWFRGALLSWDGMAVGILKKLQDASFGDAHLALRYGDFTNNLIETLPEYARFGGFDCAYDEPGTVYEF